MPQDATPNYIYDAFASYATDPDRAVVRDVEVFLESLDKNALIAAEYRVRLELCVDGSDFRLPVREGKLSSDPRSGIGEIVTAYLAQCRRLIVFVGPQTAAHHWLNFELTWWLEHRGPESILLAVTHGRDPKNERQTSFPQGVLQNDIDRWPWFDLRGYKSQKGITVREYEEERARLAASLMHPPVSAGDLVKRWKQAAARRRKQLVFIRTGIAALFVCFLVAFIWLLNLWKQSSRQARASDWALTSRQLAAGAANRKLDSLAYALAAMSQQPTPEAYAALISAIDPLVAHVRTVRHDQDDHAVDVLRFILEDKLILSGGYGGTAQFTNVAEGKIVATVKLSGRPAALAECKFAPVFAIATDKGVDLIAYAADSVHPAPRVLYHLKSESRVRSLVFHPTEPLLVVGSSNGQLTQYRFSKDFQSWRIERSTLLKDNMGASIAINGLALDWRASRMVVVGIEGVLYPLDIKRWTPVGETVRYTSDIFGVDVNERQSLAVGSDSDGGALFFDTRSAQIVGRLSPPVSVQSFVTDFQGRLRTSKPTEFPRTGIAFSPDASIVAIAGHDRTVRLYTAKEQALTHVIVERDATRSVAFSNHENLLAVGSDDGTISIWDLAQTGERWRYGGIENIAVDPKGNSVAVAADDDTLRVLAAKDGRVIGNLPRPEASSPGHRSLFDRLVFTDDSKYLASSSPGSTQALTWALVEPIGSSKPHSLQHPNEPGHVAVIAALVPGPGSSEFLAGEAHQGQDVSVWSATSGTPRFTRHMTDEVFHVAAGSDFLIAADKRGQLRVWSSRDGSEVASLSLPGIPSALAVSQNGRRFFVEDILNTSIDAQICDVSITGSRHSLTCTALSLPKAITDTKFSPLGDILAVAVEGGTLMSGGLYVAYASKHWRLEEVPGRSHVQSLAYSADGAFLAAGEREGGVSIWDTRTTKLYASIPVTNPVRSVAFSNAGDNMLITLDGVAPGFARAWDWRPKSLLVQGCTRWPSEYKVTTVPGIVALPSREEICGTK